MVDTNKFKRAVKQWVHSNPEGSLQEFQDYCEEQIPTAEYPAHKWLVEQALSWFNHVMAQREVMRNSIMDHEEVA